MSNEVRRKWGHADRHPLHMVRWLAVLTALALVVSACGEGEETTATTEAPETTATEAPTTETTETTQTTEVTADELEHITIAQGAEVILWGASYLARDSLYEEQGLEVETVILGTEVLPALLSGDAQFAQFSLGGGINAIGQGRDIVAVAGLFGEYGNNVVMAREVAEEKGITYESTEEEKVAALRGLRIGITGPGGGADQLARYILAKHGLDPERDVELIPARDNLAALEAGQIDAFVFPSPVPEIAVQQGNAIWLFKVTSGDLEELSPMAYQALWVTRSYAEEHPDKVQAAVDALTRGVEIIRDDPESAKAIVNTYFSDMDPSVLDEAWQNSLNAFTVDITPEGFEAYLEFQRVIGNDIDIAYEDVVDPSFME